MGQSQSNLNAANDGASNRKKKVNSSRAMRYIDSSPDMKLKFENQHDE